MLKTSLALLILLVSVSSSWGVSEITRSSEHPLRYPRLFVREQIDGNARFRLQIETPGSKPSIEKIDTTDPRLIDHAKEVLQRQKWRLSEDVEYPYTFEVVCSYHYMTKRLQVWMNPGAAVLALPVPFDQLSGKPVPQVKLELTVPEGEEQKPIVLKIPVEISQMGRVTFKHPERRENTAFHKDAYAALERLIFTPPILDGRPVDTEVILPVVFKP